MSPTAGITENRSILRSMYSSEWDRLDGPRENRRVSVGSFAWAALRLRVFTRDNFTCLYCGKTRCRLECDHVVPVASGGSDEIGNLQTSCFTCNRSKGAKMLSDWRPS
jgi:5-methylcytosine-specific restriction endonuclease McrA